MLALYGAERRELLDGIQVLEVGPVHYSDLVGSEGTSGGNSMILVAGWIELEETRYNQEG